MRRFRRLICSRRFAWSCLIAGFGLSIAMGLLSEGTHQDDDMRHLQFARWSWTYPAYLLHDWGRPGFTVLYAIPAALGNDAARIFSSLLAAATAWLCYDIARRQHNSFAAAVPLLFWLQPLAFTLSFTWLTETTFAFYLALGMRLLLSRRYLWSAAVISLCMATRHEGALVLAIWAGAYLIRRRPLLYHWLPLLWAPLAHNALSYVFLGEIPFADRFLNTAPTRAYGAGGWLWMYLNWQLAASVGVLLLAFVGVWRGWRRRDGKPWLLCGGAYFLAQTIIYRHGLYASGGYARFLVAVSPVVATAAAEGLGQLFRVARAGRPLRAMAPAVVVAVLFLGALWLGLETEDLKWSEQDLTLARVAAIAAGTIALASFVVLALRRQTARIVAGVWLALLFIAAVGYAVAGALQERPDNWSSPLVLTDQQRGLREAVDWLRAADYDDRRVLTANIWAEEFLGKPVAPCDASAKELLETLQPGDIVIWDAKYCGNKYHRLKLGYLTYRRDYVELQRDTTSPTGRPRWAIFELRPLRGYRPAAKSE